MIPIAYVDVANHNFDIVVVVDADGDPLVHFSHLLLIQNNLLLIHLFRKSIQTAYVDDANSKCDVVVVVDADGDIYVPLK